jgi:hypothetical protein
VTKPCAKFPRTKGCFGAEILYQISELRFSSIPKSDAMPMLSRSTTRVCNRVVTFKGLPATWAFLFALGVPQTLWNYLVNISL